MTKNFFNVETSDGYVTVKRSLGQRGKFTFVYKNGKGKVIDVAEGKTLEEVEDLSPKAREFFTKEG